MNFWINIKTNKFVFYSILMFKLIIDGMALFYSLLGHSIIIHKV